MTMLTVKQSTPYAFKSVNDIPTPPSTTRPSPLLTHRDRYKTPPGIARSQSPHKQPMSAHHRGLPPPAAITLPPQGQPPTSVPPSAPAVGHAPQPHHQQPPPPPPPSQHQHQQPQAQHAQPLGQLPPPPTQWQGSEDAMRNWLHAKAEEDRRKQEEERTHQESLRLEQRRLEHDILKTSINGGIPPPMIPVVFAGMGGGTLPQAALDWAQQFMASQAPGHPQLMPPQGGMVPSERRRDSQGQLYQHYQPPAPPAPGAPGQVPVAAYPIPPSPTRGRGHTVAGLQPVPRQAGQVSNLPHLNTNVPQHAHHQEHQASPIYFHHWQPPATQGDGGASQAAGPSGIAEPPRKRKATSLQHPQPAPPHRRSPPYHLQSQPGGLSNPPRGLRRGHQRQQSDISSYRYRHGQQEGVSPPTRGSSPGQSQFPARDSTGPEGGRPRSRGGHPVSSLLSSEGPGRQDVSSEMSHGQTTKSDESELRREHSL